MGLTAVRLAKLGASISAAPHSPPPTVCPQKRQGGQLCINSAGLFNMTPPQMACVGPSRFGNAHLCIRRARRQVGQRGGPPKIHPARPHGWSLGEKVLPCPAPRRMWVDIHAVEALPRVRRPPPPDRSPSLCSRQASPGCPGGGCIDLHLVERRLSHLRIFPTLLFRHGASSSSPPLLRAVLSAHLDAARVEQVKVRCVAPTGVVKRGLDEEEC